MFTFLLNKKLSFARQNDFKQILTGSKHPGKLAGENELAKLLKSGMQYFNTSSSEWEKECIGAGTWTISGKNTTAGKNRLRGGSVDHIPQKNTIVWEIAYKTITIKNVNPQKIALESLESSEPLEPLKPLEPSGYKDIKITSLQSDKSTHRVNLLNFIHQLKTQYSENQTTPTTVDSQTQTLIERLKPIDWFQGFKKDGENKGYSLKDDQVVEKKPLEFLLKEYYNEYFDQAKFDKLPLKTTFGAVLDTLKSLNSNSPSQQLPEDDEDFISLAENLFGGDDSKINLPFYDIVEASITNDLNTYPQLIELCEAMKLRLQSLYINKHHWISTEDGYNQTLLNRIDRTLSTLKEIKARRDILADQSETVSPIQDRFKTQLNQILLKVWSYKNNLKAALLTPEALDARGIAFRYAHNTGNDNGYHATQRANDPSPITEVHTNQTPEAEAAEFNTIAQTFAGIVWSITFEEKGLNPENLRNMKLIKMELLDFLYQIDAYNKTNPKNAFYLSNEQYKAFAALLGRQRSNNPISKLITKLRGGTTSLKQLHRYTNLQATIGASETQSPPKVANKFSIMDIEAKLLTLSKKLQKNPQNTQHQTELKNYIDELIKNKKDTQSAIATLLFRRNKLRFDLYSYVKNIEFNYNITLLDKNSEKELAEIIYSTNPIIEPIKTGNDRYTKWRSILKDYSCSNRTKADVLAWINQVSYQITHDSLMTKQQKSSLGQYLQDELSLERNGKFLPIMEHGTLAPAIAALGGIMGYGTFNWKRYFMFAHPYLSTMLSPDALAIVEGIVGISAWIGFSWLVPKTQDLKKGQTVTYNSIARRLTNMQQEIDQVHKRDLSKELKDFANAEAKDFSALTAKLKDLNSKEILKDIENLKSSPLTACRILSKVISDDEDDNGNGKLAIYNLLKYAKSIQDPTLEKELITLWQNATNATLGSQYSNLNLNIGVEFNTTLATINASNNLSKNILLALNQNDQKQIDLYSQILKASPLLAYEVLTKNYNKNSQPSLESYFNDILQSNAPLIADTRLNDNNSTHNLAKTTRINIDILQDYTNISAIRPPFLSLTQKTDNGIEKTYYFVASENNEEYIKLNLAPQYIGTDSKPGLTTQNIARCLENGEHHLLFPDHDFTQNDSLNQALSTRLNLRQTLKQLKTRAVSAYVNNTYTIQTINSEIIKALEQEDITNINFYLNLLNDDPLFAYHVLSTYDKDGTLLFDRLLQFTQKNDKDLSFFQQLSNYITPPTATDDSLKLKTLENQLMTTWSAASLARFREFTNQTDLSTINVGEIQHTIRKFIAEYPIANARDGFTAVLLFKSLILTLPKEILAQQQAKTKSLFFLSSQYKTTLELTLEANRISSVLLKEFNTMLKNMRKDPTSKFYVLRLISGKQQYFYRCLTRAFGAFIWAATVALFTIPVVLSALPTFGLSLILVPQIYQLFILPWADAARLTIYGIGDSRYISHQDTKEYLRVQELITFFEGLDPLKSPENDDLPIKTPSIIEQVNEQIKKMYAFCDQIAETSQRAVINYAQTIHPMTPNIFSAENIMQSNPEVNTPYVAPSSTNKKVENSAGQLKSPTQAVKDQYELKDEDKQYVTKINDIAYKYRENDTKREALKKHFDNLTQKLDKEPIDKASAQQFQQRIVSIIKNSDLNEMEKAELLTHFAINWYYRAYRSSLIVSMNRSVLMEKDLFIPNIIAGLGASFTTYFALPIFGLPYWCIPLIGGFGDTVPGAAPTILPNLFYQKKGINNTTTYKGCMDNIQAAIHDCLEKGASNCFPDTNGIIGNTYIENNDLENYGLLKSMLNILSLSNDRWYKNKMFTNESQKKCEKYMQGFNRYEQNLVNKYNAKVKMQEDKYNTKYKEAQKELKTISEEFIEVSNQRNNLLRTTSEEFIKVSKKRNNLSTKSTPNIPSSNMLDPRLRISSTSQSSPTVGFNHYDDQSISADSDAPHTPPPEYTSGTNTPPPQYKTESNTPKGKNGSDTPTYDAVAAQREIEQRMKQLEEQLELLYVQEVKEVVKEVQSIKTTKQTTRWFARSVPGLSNKSIESKKNKTIQMQRAVKKLRDNIRQTLEAKPNTQPTKLSQKSSSTVMGSTSYYPEEGTTTLIETEPSLFLSKLLLV
ncbi:MAG: hypothetical protein KBD37_03015 [Burkholderiales bacterium]|nr:hypothetical protein [Burkholderiales bacterium]